MIRVQPGVLADVLSALDAGRAARPELARALSQDPMLALGALAAARRQGGAGGRLSLNEAVERLNPDYLRILALSADAADRQQAERWLAAQRVAYLARLVAAHTGICDGDTAWLAGLCHDLPGYLGVSNLPAWAEEWLLAADDNGFLADAVRYHTASPARLKSAHPLVRLLHMTVALACRDDALENVEVRAALTALGLEPAQAVALRQDALEKADAARLRYTDWEAVQASGPRDRLAGAYVQYASQAALRDYFAQAPEEAGLARLLGEALCGFAGLKRVTLYVLNQQTLLPARWWPVSDSLREIAVSAEDPVSTLAQAARGNRAFWLSGLVSEASVADAQIARLLCAEAMLAEPLRLYDGTPAVLLAVNPPQDLIEMPVWRTALQALALFPGTRPMPVAPPSQEARILSAAVDQNSPPIESIPRDQVRKAVHEAANPLTIMRNYVDLLSDRLPGDAEARRDLSIIGNEIERVTGILRGLTGRTPSSGDAPAFIGEAAEVGPVNVNLVISELVRISLGTLFAPGKASVQIDLDPDAGSAAANRDQLKQVLLNLAKNAVEAMPQGGRLTFATRKVMRDGKSRVEIAVRDNGPGLPDSVKEKLFQPVASAKGGDHAGLGLSISRALIESMGGEIEYESGTEGTCFRINLPALAGSGRAQSSAGEYLSNQGANHGG